MKKKINWRRALPLYVLALPGLVYLICNNYLPMFGIIIAFKRLNVMQGIFGSPWVGFDNFKFLFQSNTAFTIIRNTVLYNVAFIIVGTFAAIAAAILLNEIKNKFASRMYQSLILLPFLMSWVVVSYIAYALLSADTGMLNSLLTSLGKEPVNWYQNRQYWPVILTIGSIWKGIGYSMIIYLSSIVSINDEYYEAARIDGATKMQQIWAITIPLLKPAIITLFILSIGRIFASDFGLFYQLPRNSGALYPVTQTIDVYVYNALMGRSDFALSSAASVFQSIVGFALVMFANALVRKYSAESALF
jgi:putative aldouronate transport system permease protein